MKPKFILTIGLLAIVLGITTTGIAIQSVQAVTPDPEAIKLAAKLATYNSLIQTSQKLTSNPSLSDQAKSAITSKLGLAASQLGPFPLGGTGPDPCSIPGSPNCPEHEPVVP